MIYKDRAEAGKKLGKRLKKLELKNPVVFGMARGGVPVATEVANILSCPLDVVVVRKLGTPRNPEFGFGAIAPKDTIVTDDQTVTSLGITQAIIDRVKAKEVEILNARLQKFRGDKENPVVKGKEVVIVDDGIATGVSAKAAIKYLNSLRPKKTILAAPVSSIEAAQELKKEVDKIVILQSPTFFSAVGQWYKEFPQIKDAEVIGILKKANS